MSRRLSALKLAGQKFGRLTVIRRAGSLGRNALWLCRCECGEEVKVRSDRLVSGQRKTCAVNGHKWNSESPGLIKKFRSEYVSWLHMRERCYYKKHSRYKVYGRRGIRVCAEWKNSFAKFMEDMGPKPGPQHTIERKDVNGNYEKGNCRWATRSEQYRNLQRSIYVVHEGQRKLLLDVPIPEGMSATALRSRLALGWTLEDALMKPLRRHKNRMTPTPDSKMLPRQRRAG